MNPFFVTTKRNDLLDRICLPVFSTYKSQCLVEQVEDPQQPMDLSMQPVDIRCIPSTRHASANICDPHSLCNALSISSSSSSSVSSHALSTSSSSSSSPCCAFNHHYQQSSHYSTEFTLRKRSSPMLDIPCEAIPEFQMGGNYPAWRYMMDPYYRPEDEGKSESVLRNKIDEYYATQHSSSASIQHRPPSMGFLPCPMQRVIYCGERPD